MLLANVAWILAANKQRVLVVDWDLEAPGLHRYFYPFLVDRTLEATEGMIDMLTEFALEAMTPVKQPRTTDWYKPLADVTNYAVALDYPFPKPGLLHFVPAGKQSSTYATSVNSFDWQHFYDELGGGAFLEAVRESMTDYDWVLIDSRTGVSDTAGICTVQMPDSLVVCFTYNNQSVEGASGVAESVIKQRKPGFCVFPIPTRVEDGETKKLELARTLAHERFAKAVRWMQPGTIEAYWNRVEIPYKKFYAYEEILATFGDKAGVSQTVLESCVWLVERLTNGAITSLPALPESERQRLLAEFERAPNDRGQATLSHDVFVTYSSEAAEPLASEIAAYLRAQSLSVRIETRNEAPTTDAELASARHMVAVIDGRGPSSQQLSRIGLFFNLSLRDPAGGRKLVPVLTPQASRDALPSVLQQVATIETVRGNASDAARAVYALLMTEIKPAPEAVKQEREPSPGSEHVSNAPQEPTPSGVTTDGPDPGWNRRRILLVVAGAAVCAVLLVVLVKWLGGTGPHTKIDANMGGEDPTPHPEPSKDEEKRQLLLTSAQSVGDDWLLKALILREIPESVFPAETVAGLLDGAPLPEAVFTGANLRDVELTPDGQRVLLVDEHQVVIASLDRTSARQQIEASGLQTAFFVGADGLALIDRDGLRLRRTATGSLTKVEIPGDPRRFVAHAVDPKGEEIVVATDGSGPNGTQNSIYIVHRDQTRANRLLDSKQAVRAVGFIASKVHYVRADGAVAVFVKVDDANEIGGLDPTLPTEGSTAVMDGAAAASAGQRWIAWGPGQGYVNQKLKDPVMALAVNQQRVAAASEHEIVVMDHAGHTLLVPRVSGYRALAISNDRVLVGTTGGFSVAKIGSNAAAEIFDSSGAVSKIAMARHAARAAVVFANGTIKLWNLDNRLHLKGKTGAQILQQLSSATTACLTSQQRETLLGEATATALEKFHRCNDQP